MLAIMAHGRNQNRYDVDRKALGDGGRDSELRDSAGASSRRSFACERLYRDIPSERRAERDGALCGHSPHVQAWGTNSALQGSPRQWAKDDQGASPSRHVGEGVGCRGQGASARYGVAADTCAADAGETGKALDQGEGSRGDHLGIAVIGTVLDNAPLTHRCSVVLV
jgi:hypothetical protein